MNNKTDYNLFHQFIDTYSTNGFNGIDRNDSLILELEQAMVKNNQFFFVCDIIKIKILFTSMGSTRMIGVEPEETTPYHFFEATHPLDIQRHSNGRLKLFRMAQDLFIEGKGASLLSSNLKIRNPGGGFSNLLFQCYLFYREIPCKTVYLIQIHTNIDWCSTIKKGCHYYAGNDFSYFHYPDKEMLSRGIEFSYREFQIIQLIASGLSSDQIAENLFISANTVNTHRRNILNKTCKTNLSELIFELKDSGLL